MGVTWIGLHVLFLQAESEIVTLKWCVHAFHLLDSVKKICINGSRSLERICFTNNNLELLEVLQNLKAKLKRAGSDHLVFYFANASNALLLQPHWDLLQGDLYSILDIQIEVIKLTFFWLETQLLYVFIVQQKANSLLFTLKKEHFFFIDCCRKQWMWINGKCEMKDFSSIEHFILKILIFFFKCIF